MGPSNIILAKNEEKRTKTLIEYMLQYINESMINVCKPSKLFES